MHRVINQIIGYMHRIEDGLLVGLFVTIFILANVTIVFRVTADVGIPWAETAIRILILWWMLVGALVATRNYQHIAIDLLTRYIPDKYCRIPLRVIYLLSSVVCGYVGYVSIDLIKVEYEDQMMAFGEVPVWLCELIIPVAFFLMAVRFLFQSFIWPVPLGKDYER